MPTVNCSGCHQAVQYTTEDVVTCGCGKRNVVRANYKMHKALIELDCSGFARVPNGTVTRALGYASAIYRMATHDETFAPRTIEAQVKSLNFKSSQTGSAALHGQFSRGFQNVQDPRVGLMFVVASGAGGAWHQIHVVFRGSRGDYGDANPMSAGWDPQTGDNVDWYANLTTQFAAPPWRAGTFVHSGFLGIYSSVQVTVQAEVTRLLASHPGATVVISGHSLGAALSVLAAHHLQCTGVCSPFCFPFNTPMVGNMQFTSDYRSVIASQTALIAGEGSTQFNRTLNFIRKNDPVSKGRHGFRPVADAERRRVASMGTSTGTLGQVATLKADLRWRQDKKQIFYQTPNVFCMPETATLLTAHQYTGTQGDVIGARLFK